MTRNLTVTQILEEIKKMEDFQALSYYSNLNDSLRSNYSIVLEVAKKNNYSVLNNLENDFTIMMAIDSLKDGNIYFSLEEEKQKKPILKNQCLKYNIDIYEEIKKTEEETFSNVLRFIKINPLVFLKVNNELKEDIDFIAQSLYANIMVWDLINEDVKKDLINDEEFILNLTEEDGMFYTKVINVYPEHKEMLKNFLESMKNKESVILKTMSKEDIAYYSNLDNVIPLSLKKDKDFILDLLSSKNISEIKAVSYFPDDEDIVKVAIRNTANPKAVFHKMSQDLKESQEIIDEYIIKSLFSFIVFPKDKINTLVKIVDILEKRNYAGHIFINETSEIDDLAVINDNKELSEFIEAKKNIRGEFNIPIEDLIGKIENIIMHSQINTLAVKKKGLKF